METETNWADDVDDEEEGGWEMLDDQQGVRAVDSADNSPASNAAQGEETAPQLDLDAEDLGSDDEDGESRDRRQERFGDSRAPVSQTTVAMDIRIGLSEQPKDADRFHHLVEVLGVETAQAVFDVTMQQEAAGGALTAQGKRRSAGGAFFEVLKNFASEEQLRTIDKFRKDKQKEGARNKVVKDVSKTARGGAGGKAGAGGGRGGQTPAGGAGINKRGPKRGLSSPTTGGSGGGGDGRRSRQQQPAGGGRQRGGGRGRRQSIQRTPRPQAAAASDLPEHRPLVI